MITEELLKGYAGNSAAMLNWSITLIGASFLLILNDSYYKPEKYRKLVYFIFFPAWMLMAVSIKCSINISNTYLSKEFVNKAEVVKYKNNLMALGNLINKDYNCQIQCFYWACSLMVICVATIIIFYIFDNNPKPK